MNLLPEIRTVWKGYIHMVHILHLPLSSLWTLWFDKLQFAYCLDHILCDWIKFTHVKFSLLLTNDMFFGLGYITYPDCSFLIFKMMDLNHMGPRQLKKKCSSEPWSKGLILLLPVQMPSVDFELNSASALKSTPLPRLAVTYCSSVISLYKSMF